MPGYSPFLPLTIDPNDGIKLNQTYVDVAKQNFKMLLLTNPGEKIMDSNFGVGLPRFFFEPITPATFSNIQSRIRKQTKIYLPYIRFISLDIGSDPITMQSENSIAINIEYEFTVLNILDAISLDFNINPDVI